MEVELKRNALDLRDIVKVNLKGIQMFGYLCPEYNSNFKIICYRVYSVLIVSFIYVACISTQLADLIASFGDIEKITNASFLTLTNVVQGFKLYPFLFHGTRVIKLIGSFNRKHFRPKNLTQQRILLGHITNAQLISKSWLSTCCVVCSLWGIFPLLDKKPNESVHLPLSGWFPFKTDESPVFEIVYVYQTLTSFVNGLGVVCMDTFIMGVIIVVAGQLDLLNNSLEDIKTDNLDKREMKQRLIESIIHHRNILEFADEMTSLFSACMTSQFIVGVIISCISLFQLTLVSIMSLQFVSMFLYEGCVLLEMFLWCYYGNEVFVKSATLANSAYFSDWVDFPKDMKKDLVILMTRSRVPLKLYVGGYFPLSLETFMTIAKSSWSYFAVLNRIHSK